MVRQRRSTISIRDVDAFSRHTSNVASAPLPPPQPFGMRSPRRWSVTATAVFLTLLAGLSWLLLTSLGQDTLLSFKRRGPVSSFHLLVPASSSNQNLCRLLFSAVVLSYPPPVLINWDAIETDNPYVQHLGKIDKVLAYLEHFPKEQDDDLVLMVDGYDVWFQLPPDVLIRRYFEIIRGQNERIKKEFGADIAKEHDFQQTILFGPDKACWPDEEGGRPACWAVPQSTLPKYAFGPYEDIGIKDPMWTPYHVRARWLNSGTIMGPVKDVRALFEAAAARVRDHRQGESDQYYFATLWGFQEFARLQLTKDGTIPPNVTEPDLVAETGGNHQIDYHVSLDYEAAMFQPIGYYDPYLTWLLFDGSIQAGRPKDSPLPDIDAFELVEDIKAARPPLAVMRSSPKKNLNDISKALFNYADGMRLSQWSELPLLTNVISKHVPVVLHFMFEKPYRVKWWDKMWYAPYAKDLFRASAVASNVPLFKKPLNGRLWVNTDLPMVVRNPESAQGRRDGAWSDKGEWLSWGILCEAYNDHVFGKENGPDYNDG